MAVAVSEAHHLVLNRRTIARTQTLNRTAIDRRAVEISTDQCVALRRGACNMADHLLGPDPATKERKGLRSIVAALNF